MSQAQLSAIVTALEDLTARISVMAEEAAGDGDDATGDSAGSSLFEVERSLRGALRRLDTIRS